MINVKGKDLIFYRCYANNDSLIIDGKTITLPRQKIFTKEWSWGQKSYPKININRQNESPCFISKENLNFFFLISRKFELNETKQNKLRWSLSRKSRRPGPYRTRVSIRVYYSTTYLSSFWYFTWYFGYNHVGLFFHKKRRQVTPIKQLLVLYFLVHFSLQLKRCGKIR